MNDRELKQLFAELLKTQSQSQALVVAALSRQIDPVRFSADLRESIEAAKKTRMVSSLAIDQATESLAAVDAEIHLRAMDQNPAKH